VHHGASEPLFFVTSPINKHRRADARQGDPPLRHSTQNDNRQYAPDRISHISIHTEEAEPLSRSAPRGQNVGLPRNRAEQRRLARFPEIRQITGLLRCAIHASGGELRANDQKGLEVFC
jgi:hypothetical protein